MLCSRRCQAKEHAGQREPKTSPVPPVMLPSKASSAERPDSSSRVDRRYPSRSPQRPAALVRQMERGARAAPEDAASAPAWLTAQTEWLGTGSLVMTDDSVKQLGAIAVSFNSFIQRMDNIDFLGTFARGLLATHSVCAWQPFRATHQRHQRSGGWLVAVHKARAPAHEARCVEALGCSAATKFPPEQIPSSC